MPKVAKAKASNGCQKAANIVSVAVSALAVVGGAVLCGVGLVPAGVGLIGAGAVGIAGTVTNMVRNNAERVAGRAEQKAIDDKKLTVEKNRVAARDTTIADKARMLDEEQIAHASTRAEKKLLETQIANIETRLGALEKLKNVNVVPAAAAPQVQRQAVNAPAFAQPRMFAVNPGAAREQLQQVQQNNTAQQNPAKPAVAAAKR